LLSCTRECKVDRKGCNFYRRYNSKSVGVARVEHCACYGVETIKKKELLGAIKILGQGEVP
jgi:hypothetical protein